MKNDLSEILSNYEKEKSKHLINLLDDLQGQCFNLPKIDIENFIEVIKTEIIKYNKYNKLQLKHNIETKSNITSLKVYTETNEDQILLCNLKFKEELELRGIFINNIADYLKELDRKELKLTTVQRKTFLEMIEKRANPYSFYSDNTTNIHVRIMRHMKNTDITIVLITKEANGKFEPFSRFTIIEI